MKNTEKITLADGKEITLAMLPLRAYGDLLVTLQGLFKEMVNEWDNATNDAIIERLPAFINDHMEEAGQIIEVATRGEITAKEALDERGLADAIAIISTAVAVNDVDGIIANVKKAAAVFRKQKAPTKTPPTK